MKNRKGKNAAPIPTREELQSYFNKIENSNSNFEKLIAQYDYYIAHRDKAIAEIGEMFQQNKSKNLKYDTNMQEKLQRILLGTENELEVFEKIFPPIQGKSEVMNDIQMLHPVELRYIITENGDNFDERFNEMQDFYLTKIKGKLLLSKASRKFFLAVYENNLKEYCEHLKPVIDNLYEIFKKEIDANFLPDNSNWTFEKARNAEFKKNFFDDLSANNDFLRTHPTYSTEALNKWIIDYDKSKRQIEDEHNLNKVAESLYNLQIDGIETLFLINASYNLATTELKGNIKQLCNAINAKETTNPYVLKGLIQLKEKAKRLDELGKNFPYNHSELSINYTSEEGSPLSNIDWFKKEDLKEALSLYNECFRNLNHLNIEEKKVLKKYTAKFLGKFKRGLSCLDFSKKSKPLPKIPIREGDDAISAGNTLNNNYNTSTHGSSSTRPQQNPYIGGPRQNQTIFRSR